jgi:hypothetical protein
MFGLDQIHSRARFHHHHDLSWRIGRGKKNNWLLGSVIEHPEILLFQPSDEIPTASHRADIDFHDFGGYLQRLLCWGGGGRLRLRVKNVRNETENKKKGEKNSGTKGT